LESGFSSLPLRTTSDGFSKLRQVISPDTQDTSKAHRWKLPQAVEAYQLFDKQTSGKGVFLM
jgi:hypothetical protein